MTCIKINNRTKTPMPRFLDYFSFDTFTYRAQNIGGILPAGNVLRISMSEKPKIGSTCSDITGIKFNVN